MDVLIDCVVALAKLAVLFIATLLAVAGGRQ